MLDLVGYYAKPQDRFVEFTLLFFEKYRISLFCFEYIGKRIFIYLFFSLRIVGISIVLKIRSVKEAKRKMIFNYLVRLEPNQKFNK